LTPPSSSHLLSSSPLLDDLNRIPIDIARNFSCQTLTIVLNIEADHHPSHQSPQFSAFWLEKCREVFQEALSAGHRHVILVSIEFVGNFAKVIQVESSSSPPSPFAD
jgi:hypothetical protein